MELEEDLWLVGPYYVDIDQNRQLRIVGPNNHLYFGAKSVYSDRLSVVSAAAEAGELKLTLHLQDVNFLPDPAMGHIRRIRHYTQIRGQPEPTFESIDAHNPDILSPTDVRLIRSHGHNVITYRRRYGEHYYGIRLEFPDSVRVVRSPDRSGFELSGLNSYDIVLHTETDTLPTPYSGEILNNIDPGRTKLPSAVAVFTDGLMIRSAKEIDHLVRHGKTSGYDYGTVFPRDWMEAADLGSEDFTPSALEHLYSVSLKHVNADGAGWHEDIVGEFEYERKRELEQVSAEFKKLVSSDHPFSPEFFNALHQFDELFVTRLMLDIEPHYLMGLRLVPFESFSSESQRRLRLVAGFVIGRAQKTNLVTFNRIALPFRRTKDEEYYNAGNWRDSTLAFKQVHPVIAPYDVNVVFYPQALRVIKQYRTELDIGNVDIDGLIAKWDRTKDWFRITNPDGKTAFALALYDVHQSENSLTFAQLHVNHIDESYDLFYGEPDEPDVASFADRLLDPDYFFTPSGPTLVGHGDGYDHSQYHGEVIWIKQTAYVVAGLERQLYRGITLHWDKATLTIIKQALVQTAEVSLQAFTILKEFPELHYDDHGTPRLYTDQPAPEGQMNTVQLWSAVGARRILRTYLRHLAQ